MGCITFEFIIWLLYGNDELAEFHRQLRRDAGFGGQFFEIIHGHTTAQLHHVVRRWMDYMQENDTEMSQSSALNDLLELVKSRLLIVPVSSGGSQNAMVEAGTITIQVTPPVELAETSSIYRATAPELVSALDTIIDKMDSPGYLVTGKRRDRNQLPSHTLPISSTGVIQ